jgi:YidC/Oxa1 family membrane protein insertase
METFFDAFATVLAFFYDLVPNYAIAISLLTLLVMIILTPLTLKGTRSMMVMQQLQPEMKKIQQKYKDDREQLNAELLKFYKENNINPLGGCLPLLAQAPVFIVLYQVLRGLTRRATDVGFQLGWSFGQAETGAAATKAPSVERVFDPAYLDPASKMYQDLSSSTQMEAFGLDLSESASSALSQGIVHALPFLVLIGIVAVTGFVQQRQVQGRNPNAQINPQQQMIMKIMPIFLPVISFGLPGGLVLYFVVSNLYRIGQQAFISRSIYGMKNGAKPGDGKAAAGKAVGKGAKAIDVAEVDAVDDEPAGGDAADEGSAAAPERSPFRLFGGKSKPAADDAAPAKGAPTKSARGKGQTTSGRAQPSKKKTEADRRSSSSRSSRGSSRTTDADQQPTLQPRARKNRKR